MAQPASAPRWSRQARPNGPRSTAEAVARPGRSGSSPAPSGAVKARQYYTNAARDGAVAALTSMHDWIAGTVVLHDPNKTLSS